MARRSPNAPARRSPTIPRSRPWYKAAANGTTAIAVGPYVMATTKSLGLTLATPMSKDHAVVVGADVLLETLSGLLAQEAVSAHSRGYVFDDQKRIIVHSEKAMMDLILENLSAGRRGKSARIHLPDPVLDAVRELLGRQERPAGRHRQLSGRRAAISRGDFACRIFRARRGQHGGHRRTAVRFHRGQRSPSSEGPADLRHPAGGRHRRRLAGGPARQQFAVRAHRRRKADRRPRIQPPAA